MKQADAISLCRQFEEHVADLGWHVALTGGCLYKDGDRKDADIMLYQHDITDESALSEVVVRRLEKRGLFTPRYDTPASTTDKEVWVGDAGPATFSEGRIDLFFV